MNNQWKWYVYIIECKDGLYYTGMTWDVDQRMIQHQSGKGSKFTARHGFKKRCYTEEFDNITAAREREAQLKVFLVRRKKLCGLTTNCRMRSSSRITSNDKEGGRVWVV